MCAYVYSMLLRSLVMLSASLMYRLPAAFDATTENTAQPCRIMGTVFQQGDCSSCAAFASASALSMRLCLVEKEDYIPSPYRLFDCVSPSCENGTNLRYTGAALMRGIPDVSASPRRFGLGCHHTKGLFDRLLYGYIVGLTNAMRLDLYLFGPSIVALHGTPAFAEYTGGVYHPTHVGPDMTKHSVVLVGWGSLPEPHWVVLNSWGPTWGEKGKARVAAGVFQSHYSWRTKTETVVESSLLFGYFAFLFFAVAACGVFLPDKDARWLVDDVV